MPSTLWRQLRSNRLHREVAIKCRAAAIKHCRTQGEPTDHPELIHMPKAGEDAGERDELFEP